MPGRTARASVTRHHRHEPLRLALTHSGQLVLTLGDPRAPTARVSTAMSEEGLRVITAALTRLGLPEGEAHALLTRLARRARPDQPPGGSHPPRRLLLRTPSRYARCRKGAQP